MAAIFRVGAAHAGIRGTLAVSCSEDGGKTWSDPIEIAPRWLDNRNPAFGVSASGELIAAYWKAGLHSYVLEKGRPVHMFNREQDNREHMKRTPATFVVRSSDGGRTWSPPQELPSKHLLLISPFGRIVQAPNSELLMSACGILREPLDGVEDACVLFRSRDGGRTWGDETLVTMMYNETSYAFLPDGRLLAAARSQGGSVQAHVSVFHSEDGGRTWSTPVQVTRNGEHPADLTTLDSGAVLLTFGRRVKPMGCGALLSRDGGRSWDINREVLLAGDGMNFDLGYPSTVQLADGAIVTLIYFASGSAMSDDTVSGWGQVSCQAIHYFRKDIE